MDWGSIPGGSKDFGLIVNRHTQVDSTFKKSWFAVTRPGQEVQLLGEYTPYVLNLHEKANFEALGCSVERARLDALVAATKAGLRDGG